MITKEDHEGPTPNGGVRSTIYYQGADGQPADRDAATRCVIVEYDAQGEEIQRTYGTCGGGGGGGGKKAKGR